MSVGGRERSIFRCCFLWVEAQDSTCRRGLAWGSPQVATRTNCHGHRARSPPLCSGPWTSCHCPHILACRNPRARSWQRQTEYVLCPTRGTSDAVPQQSLSPHGAQCGTASGGPCCKGTPASSLLAFELTATQACDLVLSWVFISLLCFSSRQSCYEFRFVLSKRGLLWSWVV